MILRCLSSRPLPLAKVLIVSSSLNQDLRKLSTKILAVDTFSVTINAKYEVGRQIDPK